MACCSLRAAAAPGRLLYRAAASRQLSSPLNIFRKGFSEQSVLPITDSIESFQGPSVQNTLRIPLYDDSISSGILDTSSNPTQVVTQADPAKGRIMLVDGTSVMYRSYYKILAQLQHGQLEHADGNGDWVLTIFKALSLLLDMLEFIPSHAAVVFDHDGVPYGHYTAMPSKECHMAKGKSVRCLKLVGQWEKAICGSQLASWRCIEDLGLIHNPCIVFTMAWSHVLLDSIPWPRKCQVENL